MNKQNAADLAELFRVLGMEEAARDVVREYTEAQKAATKREQRGNCVVLRPSVWNARPQKEGARQGSRLNGFALETKVALVSKEGFQAASKTAVQKGKVNGHPLKTKATVQRPQPIAKGPQDERKPNKAPGVFLGR